MSLSYCAEKCMSLRQLKKKVIVLSVKSFPCVITSDKQQRDTGCTASCLRALRFYSVKCDSIFRKHDKTMTMTRSNRC